MLELHCQNGKHNLLPSQHLTLLPAHLGTQYTVGEVPLLYVSTGPSYVHTILLSVLYPLILYTDSNYFTISSSSGRSGCYQLMVDMEPPATVPTPKRGAASLHVYMGCTAFGLTDDMVLVLGGSLKNSRFFRKDGSLYSGVSAAEYQDVVLPGFKRKADGKVLFGRRSWIVQQQDGATGRIHTAAASMVEARALAPGGLLEPWPANSPDFIQPHRESEATETEAQY